VRKCVFFIAGLLLALTVVFIGIEAANALPPPVTAVGKAIGKMAAALRIDRPRARVKEA
jgi:hypothetical protein